MAKGEDRISLLPDCMILEILSRLDDTKYAIRTGTLSKRWQHLWPQLPNLLVFTPFPTDNIPQFYSSLKRILLSQTTQLNKFRLHAYYTDNLTPVNKCIRLAIRRNVREVDFDLFHEYSLMGGNWIIEFVLPGFFFTCSSFTRVSLCGCSFEGAGVISWESLRTLQIEGAELNEDMIQNILSGSPLLETLELDGCYGFERIDITSNKSVKNLGLFLFEGLYVSITAPYILSLEIQGNLMLNDFMLQNVSSLSNFELDTWEKNPVATLEEQEMNEELLKGHLLKLVHANETLTRLKAKGFIVPSNLKVLGEVA